MGTKRHEETVRSNKNCKFNIDTYYSMYIMLKQYIFLTDFGFIRKRPGFPST